MKNENITKINTLGKICKILVIIFNIFNMAVAVCSFIAGFVILALPSDSIRVKGEGTAQIIVESESVKNLMDIEEANFDTTIHGVPLKWIVSSNKDSDGVVTYDIEFGADNVTAVDLKLASSLSCFATGLVMIALFVSLCFGKKLATALEKCNSPFEDEVLRRMKNFVIAMIPWAVISISVGGLNGLAAAVIVVIVLIFSRIFKYGAQLQRESDETL